MKQYFILLMAIFGSAIADVTLTDDIDDFVALFPADNTISDIVAAYLKSDAKTEAAIEYFGSSDLESKIASLTNLAEFEAVKNFVKDAGLEPSSAINAMSRILGMSDLVVAMSSREKSSEVIISGGFEGFFGDVFAAFPAESIAAIREKKLISSPVFAKFVEKITSQEFQDRLTALQATKEHQELFKLLSPRVSFSDFVNLFASAIGLGSDRVAYNTQRPIRSLHENTNDFIDLSSNSDDTEIGQEYLPGSKLQRMIQSLESDEFTEIVDSLKKTEGYHAIEKSIQEAGLDLKTLYRKLYHIFIQHDLSSGHSEADAKVADESKSTAKITKKIRAFFGEYRNRKATEETEDLYREKHSSSAAFDTLIERTRSDHLIALRDALKTKEQSRKIKDLEKDIVSLLAESMGIYAEASA